MRLRLQQWELSEEVGLGHADGSCYCDQPGSGSWALNRPRPAAIMVNLAVGPDDALFIRGRGGGLSWNKGQPLASVHPTRWVWSATAAGLIEFQLLLNDQVWERGAIHMVAPGAALELTPDFEWPEIPRVAPPEIVTVNG